MGLQGFARQYGFESTSEVMREVVEGTFNARIQIVDPKVSTGEYNRTTNTISGQDEVVLWEGPARIQAMRWPGLSSARGDTISMRTVVFHIPYDAHQLPQLVRDGMRIRVIDGGLASDFERGLFVVTTSVNTSYAWDGRIETTMDQGAEID